MTTSTSQRSLYEKLARFFRPPPESRDILRAARCGFDLPLRDAA
jgi:hypothetical protein